MQEIDKYNSPGYSVIQTWKMYALFLAPIITSIGILAFIVRKTDLTFDNQKQKYDTVQHHENGYSHMTFEKGNKIEVLDLKVNSLIKEQQEMNTKIDNEAIRSKGADKKLGGDLAEIKVKIDNINKK